MTIYGTALLSFCVIFGATTGRLIGQALGLKANVGGVGIAMILLVFLADRLRKSGRLDAPMEMGVTFWCAIYIPIVVALAASQNVRAALHGGPAAIIAGVLSVAACFALVPVINRIGLPDSSPDSKDV